MRRSALAVLACALVALPPAQVDAGGSATRAQTGEIQHVANVAFDQARHIDFGAFDVRVLDANGDPVCVQDTQGECLLDQQGNVVYRTEARDYAFAGRNDRVVEVVDVTDPRQPVSVSQVPCRSLLSDPHVAGEVLLVGGTGGCTMPSGAEMPFRGFATVDVSDPRFPRVLAGTDLSPAHRLAVHPTQPLVYVAETDGDARSIPIYDISDPSAPVLVQDWPTVLSPHELSISPTGTRLHVAGMTHIAVVGLEDPRNPRLVSLIPYDGNLSYYAEATPDGRWLLAGDGLGPTGLNVYDLAAAEVPARVGAYRPGPYAAGEYPNGFDLSPDGTVAAVGWRGGGVYVLDVSDPAGFGGPGSFVRAVASYRFEGADTYAAELWTERHPGYVFATDTGRGLDVFYLPALDSGFLGFGSIRAGNPLVAQGQGVTAGELTGECDPSPETQGLDGWVVALPPSAPGAAARLDVEVSATGALQVRTRFFDASCGPLAGGGSGTGQFPIPPQAAFALTEAAEGAGLRIAFHRLPVGSGVGCSNTSIGLDPLTDMSATDDYQGARGGLYPGVANEPPPAYLATGTAFADQVRPRGPGGQPDPAGRIVLLSIGMSNTRDEFQRFYEIALGDSTMSEEVALVNGARGGDDAEEIRDPASHYWGYVDQRLTGAGLTREQVQAVWLKQAFAGPEDGFPAHGERLRDALADIVGILRSRFPNLQLVHLSSRIYAGYATTGLNPEPWAYESGFAVKWLIEDQIEEDPARRPWVGWGPYLWADGTRPRGDGLVWLCEDLMPDGTHPSDPGRTKVATMLLDFYETNATTDWFHD